MGEGKESYEQTESDRAREMLTSTEKRLSEMRERTLGKFRSAEQNLEPYKEDPAYNPKSPQSGSETYLYNRLKMAERRDERIFEVPIQLEFTVRVPESYVL